ncbi:MAG: diguanylate cyclase [Desulfobacterales bacterium]
MSLVKENRVLVVDDEEALLEAVSQVLKRGGYAVATASNGEEAWELFLSNPYPVVVTDLDMKNMSGMDLLQKIKQHHPDTQVIIMTNHASIDSVTMSLRCNAFDYLSKPFDPFNLFMTSVTRAMKKYDQIRENLLEINRLREKIEEIENANKLLKNLTIRDGLTGLFNYRYFQEDLAYELLRSGRFKRTFSLLFIKVDGFQSFIEKYGQTEADKLLLTISHQLKRNLRKTDLLARHSDEKFVAILPETPKQASEKLAHDLCTRMANQIIPQNSTWSTYKVYLSMGVSTYPTDGNDGSTLLKKAEKSVFPEPRCDINGLCIRTP